MKNAPNSKANLDKAIDRFAGNPLRANEVRNLMANAIVAQLIGNGVVKGGAPNLSSFSRRGSSFSFQR